MRPDDRLFPGPHRPRAFTDATDGGYPVETDLEPDPTPGRQDPPADDDPPPPPSPVSGRALHNPLPPVRQATTVEDDWYGPEPARARWRVITPIAVLIASAALGIWLALPASRPPQASTPAPSPATSPSTRVSDQPAAPRTSTPRASTTRAPSRTPRPASTRTPAPRRQRTMPPATERPPPTVTTTVTITTRPTRTPAAHGPEEPPRPASPAPPTRACLTWDDCHDDPPDD
ncbi:hypothetical protein ACU635_60685 [[Actinomadura] parvosata]|uniref:hypothetical protein n=1 Tax=[Actinomadura] parvosata TaxID=1955412 RepID=UPI00406C60F8